MLRILVITYFFRPDLSACSFRATPFVESLSRLAPAGSQIDVITTRPHRYHSFIADPEAALERENYDGVSIVRIPLPRHKGGFVDQPRAFLSFARRAIKHADKSDYDIVFATSSRLMTAALGAYVARRQKARLYLDIRDIFADTMDEVLPRKAAFVTRRLLTALERWTINSADKVNLVSRGFAEYFVSRYPRQQFSFFTNGVDEEFANGVIDALVRAQTDTDRKITVFYAGNLGTGQGMETIVPALAQRMGPRFQFKLVGEGGRKRALANAIAATGVTNVELHAPMQRAELLHAYSAADVLFLHLNDYDAFKKVLPSKLFEYAALGKPVWAGVGGYAADFVKSEITNSAVFRPCDINDAIRSFGQLKLCDEPRREFVAKYSRAKLSDALATDVLSVAAGRSA